MMGEAAPVHRFYVGEHHPFPVPLLVCSCGEAGCEAVLADVASSDGSVSWRNIRGGSVSKSWTGGYEYPTLGSFCFLETQYIQALSAPDALEADPRPAGYP